MRGKGKRARWKIWLAISLVVVAGVLSVLALQKSSGAFSKPPTQIYAVGDSITEGDSANFLEGEYGARSWVNYVDPQIVVTGGWARGGATTDDMAENVVPAPEANTLVLLAGSNDLATDVPFETTRANLERIVATVGVDEVVLSAIPPRDMDPQGVVQFNQQLKGVAQANDWRFVDPLDGVREGDRYARGMTEDGIHPTPAGAERLGQNLSKALL
ncbi:MAG TPA: hypothetical protein GXZ30_12760 [Propionibacterium sp.]|nr:hypothetical protein [Propionibacterium sp.]